jgi:hypothetical protein
LKKSGTEKNREARDIDDKYESSESGDFTAKAINS